jgi:hypothetical protein
MSTFTQVVVWPGTMMGQNTPAEFEAFIAEEFRGTQAKCIGEVVTKPDWDDPETGGRADLLFYVASEDIQKFAVARLAYGMRWLEDVLQNEAHRVNEECGPQGYSIYPDEIVALRTW